MPHTLAEAVTAMSEYLASRLPGPLFIAFDDKDDLGFLLREASACTKFRLSDYCPHLDSTPDRERFFKDVTANEESCLFLLGVGEYVALKNDNDFPAWFAALRERGWLGRIIIPLWNGYAYLARLRRDPRFAPLLVELAPTRRCWSYKNIRQPMPVQCEGFRSLLALLENGSDSEITTRVATELNPDFGRLLSSPYDLYREEYPQTSLAENAFSASEWQRLVDNNRIIDESLLSADSFLAYKQNGSDNLYMQFVINETQEFADFRNNFIQCFLDLSPADKRFRSLARARKELMPQLDDASAREYCLKTRRFARNERLAYLDGDLKWENYEIIKALAESTGRPACLAETYPDLADYLSDYEFAPIPVGAHDFGACLTEYFREYKQQKLTNAITPEFKQHVEQIALERPYNHLPTCVSIIEILDRDDAKLYWLDSLGCEYLGFITQQAEKNGLTLTIKPARAALPTITSNNRVFFDNWRGEKHRIEELDRIKHNGVDDCSHAELMAAPLHLALELQTLKKVIAEIARELKNRRLTKIVLTSDHGATRLAVISCEEEPWQMPEKGRHGGRCCRRSEFDGAVPRFVTSDDEGKWHVLANYARFKGGRPGAVEVHGGACIEEVVVPVIEFALKSTLPQVVLLSPDYEYDNKKEAIALCFFASAELLQPRLEVAGRSYSCVGGSEKLQYQAQIPQPKPGEYRALIYDGQALLGEGTFRVNDPFINRQAGEDDFFA